MEEYGKLEDTNLELMGDPGRFQPRLLAIRGKDDNNDWHKYPEHVKDPYDRYNLDTWRGKDRAWLETQLHNLTGKMIRGTIQAGGTRGTCHVWT